MMEAVERVPPGSAQLTTDVISTDVGLARRIHRGDPEALEHLYRTHYGPVLRHLRAYLGLGSSVAADLAHESFVRAFENIDRYEGRSSLSTWLRGIALNLARTHRATQTRQEGIRRRLALDPAAAPRQVDESLDRHERVEVLYRALELLPVEEREAFVMRTIEELALKEIAAVLDVGVSTVSDRNRRAGDKLRAHFNEGEMP